MFVRTFSILLLSLSLVATASGAGMDVSGKDDPRLPRLQERMAKFRAAFVNADVAVLESIVAPHYTHTNDRDQPLTREQWLDSMERRQRQMAAGENRLLQFDSEPNPVRIHGDTAIATGITIMRSIRGESEVAIRINWTHVWEWDGNDWYRIAFHDTYEDLPE